MKLRKVMSLVLCGVLCAGAIQPVMAAEVEAISAGVDVAADNAQTTDAQLLAVTMKVKDVLGLDTEEFDDFNGWASEDVLLGRRWNLEWSGDGSQLFITADDAGKIYSYSRYDTAEEDAAVTRGLGGRLDLPRLPEDKSAGALAAAQDFLGKVLDKDVETVALADSAAPSLRQTSYRFSGEILLNGLPSPVRYSLTVRGSDLAVTRFWRGDEGAGYLGGVPSGDTALTPQQARTLLTPTVELKAQYVLEENSKTAKVRYVPDGGHSFYVDGATGKLVDLTALQEQLWRYGSASGGAMAEATADMKFDVNDAAMSQAVPTQAEQNGAAILADAKSKEELDALLKAAWPEIGLEDYTLASASFSIAKKPVEGEAEPTAQDYDVTCLLTYGKQESQLLRNKYVTVDAKTGQLKALRSRRYYQGEGEETYAYALNADAAKAKAGAILVSFDAAHAPVMALSGSRDAKEQKTWEYTFTYQHTAGGYFYPDNFYTIGVDATDGTISRISGTFDGEVVLQLPAQVVTPDQAKAAYAGAMAVPYGYLEVPVSISLAGDELMPLLKEAGYSYVTALKPGFVLDQPEDSYVQGVDAETGVPVLRANSGGEEKAVAYDDISGHWVQTAAEALAAFNVGFYGGSLKPAETLTQRDMLALLLSAEGYIFDPNEAGKDTVDQLYEQGYSLGLVTPVTREEGKAVTREELVETILNGAGYGRVAALEGIYRCGFTDAAGLSAQQLGYAALAQGLGLVKGGADGAYAPARAVTRAEAVAMVYQFMK